MARVGFRTAAEGAAPQVPGEHGIGVPRPGREAGHGLRIDVGPDASLGIAERVEAGVGAHAGAGEEVHAACGTDGFAEVFRYRCHVEFLVIFSSHTVFCGSRTY